MNVFEDLVVELKEQNLLEDTVMDALLSDPDTIDFGEAALGDEAAFLRRPGQETLLEDNVLEKRRPAYFAAAVSQPQFHKNYSERAANLRMVEHVVSAVERQLSLGSTAAAFNDLQLTKALQAFLQVASDPDSDEFIEAEQNVRRSIGPWERGLASRDEKISVSELRRYCETCQPALSPQALFSLARFYYEMPKNAGVRAKFDFVVTKLFSRPTSTGGRRMICSRSEAVGHLKSRFVQWSPSAGMAIDDPKQFVLASRCADYMKAVERIDRLDDLLKGEFIDRVRSFKEEAGDLIFAPEFSAAVIESNIRIGNRFVELMQSETQQASFQQVLDEYVSDGRSSIEDASGRAFDLDEIMHPGGKKKAEAVRKPKQEMPTAIPAERKPVVREASFERAPVESSSFLSLQVNKWLLGGSLLLIVLSIGFYLWAEHYAAETEPEAARARNVALENFEYKDMIQSGRVSSETFYGVTATEWNSLAKAKKEEILTKLRARGSEHGYSKVSLTDAAGKVVGFASEQRTDIP